jgi:hypothetical protein
MAPLREAIGIGGADTGRGACDEDGGCVRHGGLSGGILIMMSDIIKKVKCFDVNQTQCIVVPGVRHVPERRFAFHICA